MMRRNKFRAKKVRADGYVFDSTLEYEYYLYLKSTVPVVSMEAKIIVHPKYEFMYNGILLCTYTADFEIVNPNGSKIVVDVKAVKFPKIKQRKDGAIYQPCHKIPSSYSCWWRMMMF